MNRPDEIRDVLDRLATLAPTRADTPTAPKAAFSQLQERIDESRPATLAFIGRLSTMMKRRYALTALLLILAVAAAFSLPPVRAAASDFLGLFRVQKFAAISVSPEQVAMLEELADQGLYPGELQTIEEPDPPQAVASLSEAVALSGYDVRTPAALPEPDGITVSGSGSGRLIVDVQAARRLMEAAGVDPQLIPESLDGQAVDVTMYPSVEMTWSDGTALMQTQSPQVDYPEDVNATALGEAFLQMLGLSPAEAQRLARDIDWTSTLVVPIPQDLATFREVMIDGVSGLALSSVDSQGNVLMWQEEGKVYVLFGDDQDVETLQQIAQTLQ